MDENEIIGFDALYTSMCKCRSGVMWKDSVAGYNLNAIERTRQLSKSLQDGTYKPKPTVKFTITSPKPREIASIIFRDRVYQRSLNDNAVYPVMTKSFIYDNYACQKGKGTDKVRERLKQFLRQYYRKNGNVGYIARFDIKGYYPNMNHGITEKTFSEKLEPETFERVQKIMREQYDGETGYNPGSQLVQIAGISVLDRFDHYVKEQLHARFYVRYMDDFFIISNDKKYLLDCFEKIESYLNNLYFELNPKKSRIYPLAEGIEFLGFNFYLTETGKVLMFVKSEKVRQERRKLRRLVEKAKRGEMPRAHVDDSYKTWRNHVSKGNNYKLLLRMDDYYKSLWG